MKAALKCVAARHAKAIVRHPHHYAVALGLTVMAFLFFHAEAGMVTSAWAYAVLENLAEG